MLNDLQSFPKTIYEGLEKGFIMGDGLENISIWRNVADSPLAQSCTAQSEDITEKRWETQNAEVASKGHT